MKKNCSKPSAKGGQCRGYRRLVINLLGILTGTTGMSLLGLGLTALVTGTLPRK